MAQWVSPRLPVGVGFGISSPEQAAAVGEFADAVVVGSAIMRVVEDHLNAPDLVERVGRFIHSLKVALRDGRVRPAVGASR